MELSKRERHMLVAGGAAVALIVLVAWVIRPLGGAWSRLGDELRPRLRVVAILRDRAERQEALLARRARLVGKVGTLLQAPEPADAGRPQGRGASEESRRGSAPAEAAEDGSDEAAAQQTTADATAEGDEDESDEAAAQQATADATAEGDEDESDEPGTQQATADATAEGDEDESDEPGPQQATADAPAEGAEDESDEPPTRQAKADVPALEALLEKAVKKSGGRVKLISAKKSPRQTLRLKHFKMTVLQVQTDLSVDSLVKLLHALEKGPRFARVDSLKVRHDLKKPGALSVTFEVIAYELPEQA